VFAEYRSFCDSFSRFCLLLVVRALSQFGISVAEDDAGALIGPAHGIRLSRSDLSLSVLSNGLIQLAASSGPLIIFVPLPAAINRARTDAELEEWVSMIHADLQNRPASCQAVVLYLSSLAGPSKTLSGEASARVWTIGNEPGSTQLRNFGSIPVSPWEIDCVERVARCVRWAITGRDLLKYPAALSAAYPSSLSQTPLPRWLAFEEDRIIILRHPRGDERRRWDFDSIWQAARQSLDSAVAQRDRAVARQERDRIAPHERRAVALQVARSRKTVEDAQRRFDELDLFRREFERTLDSTEDTSICLVCGSEADLTRGFTSDTNFYEYRCDDCNARWGVRTCSCNQRVAFMETGSLALPSDRSPGWVDRQFGRDVLAVPTGKGSFECSGCGVPV
jgi:hypothetical protein